MRSLLLFVSLCVYQAIYAQDSTTCEGKFDSDNKKHGLWVCRSGGKVVKTERYRHGVLRTYIIYNDKGEAIETRDRKGKVRTLNPCGC